MISSCFPVRVREEEDERSDCSRRSQQVKEVKASPLNRTPPPPPPPLPSSPELTLHVNLFVVYSSRSLE